MKINIIKTLNFLVRASRLLIIKLKALVILNPHTLIIYILIPKMSISTKCFFYNLWSHYTCSKAIHEYLYYYSSFWSKEIKKVILTTN